MSTPTLAYWDIRGFCQQIRHLLAYLGVDYKDKRYTGPDWFEEKFTLGLAFPNIPYFIDGDFKVTESKAILRYIAQTRGPQLVPSDARTQAVLDNVDGVATDVQRVVVDVTYGGGNLEAYEAVRADHGKKLEYLNTHLGANQFAAGDKITYEDFYLYEVLAQIANFAQALNTDILKPYENLINYIHRIEALPQLKDHLSKLAASKTTNYSAEATLLY